LATENKKELIKRAVDLFKDGYSIRNISIELDVPKSTVYRWVESSDASKNTVQLKKHDELKVKREETDHNIQATGMTDLQRYQGGMANTYIEGMESLKRVINYGNGMHVKNLIAMDNQALRHMGFNAGSGGSSRIQIDVSVLKKGASSESPVIEAELTDEEDSTDTNE
jgi:hypothetical protein